MSGVAHQQRAAAAAAPRGANAANAAVQQTNVMSNAEKDAEGEFEDDYAAAETSNRRSPRMAQAAAATKRTHGSDEIVVKNTKSNKRRKANSTKKPSTQKKPAQQSVFTSGKAARVAEEIEEWNKKAKKEKGHTGWPLFGVTNETAIKPTKVDGVVVNTKYQVVWCGTDKETDEPFGYGKVYGPENLGEYHLSRWEEFKRRTGRKDRTFDELLDEYDA